MKLHKRNCDIRIRLTPCGADFQKVQWSIGGDRHVLWPSAVMGGQFSDLVTAVYCLYAEPSFRHGRARTVAPNKGPHPEPCYRTRRTVTWDEEGRYVQITLTRRHSERSCVLPDALDFVDVELNTSYGTFCYRTEGRDLCYAVARAVTETLKKYGFMGYCLSSDPDCRSEETIDINKLLFLKAYALDVPEARQIVRLWEDPNGWMSADASCFQKEMELLLFDM